MALPKVTVQQANANKRQQLSGVVTVGPESAVLLTKKLGRKVEPGEQFDLGVLATYDPNPFKMFWANLKSAIAHTRSPFRKPLQESKSQKN